MLCSACRSLLVPGRDQECPRCGARVDRAVAIPPSTPRRRLEIHAQLIAAGARRAVGTHEVLFYAADGRWPTADV